MTLAELIAAARKDHPRVAGVAVVSQNHAVDGNFVALCVDAVGHACDPRSWDTHPTPEAALKDLERQLAK